jgi:hypothetical protein
MGITAYDTEQMRSYSGNIEESANIFKDNVDLLYRLVEELVADDFTGDVGTGFSEEVLSKKNYYLGMYDTLVDCAGLIKEKSGIIDDNTQMLNSQIRSGNYFE